MTTLEQMLAARDERARLQKSLLAENPGATLLCATVVTPGPEKSSPRVDFIAEAMAKALKEEFDTETITTIRRRLATGHECYLLLSAPLLEAKRRACDIEERHPLGRLFDIDAIDAEGRPVERSKVGREARGCLLCGENARVCMRLAAHSPAQIDEHITHMVHRYRQTLNS